MSDQWSASTQWAEESMFLACSIKEDTMTAGQDAVL